MCRHCGNPLGLPCLDLGAAPPSNAFLTEEALHRPEAWYPLRVLACEHCWLVQTEDIAAAHELFSAEYPYFSSYSSTWLAHAERYVDEVTARFHLSRDSHVVEVGANDGYLLQFLKRRDIPCLGIEPTSNAASAARARGITIVERFFGNDLARELFDQGLSADLVAANNVLAHVPRINDFCAGFSTLLKPQGVATFEFPHLIRLISENQFDTIYHEHFSYLSLTAVDRIFLANNLKVFDVEELETHGGSLRVFAERLDTGRRPRAESVNHVLQREAAAGVLDQAYYTHFQTKAERVKNAFLSFLLRAWEEGHKVAAYGAAAKGNTILNFSGVRPDLLPYVVDQNPAKQGKFLPGSRIPIVSEDHLQEDRPDIIIILPWNLRNEISEHLSYARSWGGRFVTAIPSLSVW